MSPAATTRTVLLAQEPSQLPGGSARAVAIGNFDGVHLGHRRVISAITGRGLQTTVVTFDPHPRSFFGAQVPELCSFRRRVQLLAETGVDEIMALRFSREMAALEPEEWVERYLRPIGAEVVAVGEDFRFGRDRRGDVALLRELGLEVHALPRGDGVSSSRVRELIGRGRLDGAAELLGRPHELDVTVLDVAARRDVVRLELVGAGHATALPPSGAYVGELAAAPAAGSPAGSAITLTRADDGRARISMRVARFAGDVGERLRLLLRRPTATAPLRS